MTSRHSFRFVFLCTLLWLLGSGIASAQDMIRFISPAPASDIKNGTTTISLRLDASADPSTLKVLANNRDVTSQFRVSACAVKPCSISATFNSSNGLMDGWNYLTATVTTAGGAAGSARTRFFSEPGHALRANRVATAGVSSAMDVPIFPFNYYPPFTVHMYTTSAGQICVFTDCVTNPYIWLIDRRTLAVVATQAPLSVLPTLDGNTIVIVNLPGTAAGTMDFSSVGGTNFTASGAPVPYNYTMVGYGGAQPGTAYECYNGNPDTPWHGIEGNFVNAGSNTPFYTFVPDGNPAFVVQPGATVSSITVGSVQNFNLGSVPPPNRVTPALGLGTTQFTSPDKGEAAGGFWVLVLDPFVLTQVSSTFYGTNCSGCTTTTSAAQIQHMYLDLELFQERYAGSPNTPEYRPVVFISTVGTPFDSATVANDFVGDPANQIVGGIWNLGTSQYAFSDLTGPGSPAFSMIGIPGTNENAGTAVWARYSAPTNPQAAKWFSTTVDGDTGALKGLLKRNTQFTYVPNNVGSFDASALPSNPTADELLSFAIIDQLGSSSPVTWPIENGAAYQYLSAEMISQDFYGGAGCGAPQMVCNDIHFYYTGDEVDGIVTGIDPRTIPYPGDGLGFTQQDLAAVATQLNYEKTYLGNVRNFEKWMQDVETNGSVNIGTALTSAATEVSSQLNQVEGLNSAPVPETKLHLATDIINDAASVIGAFGPAVPVLGVLSGGLRLTANLLTTGMDLDGSKPPKPDPYVNQLSDLLSSQAGQAASAAVKFNSDMQVGTGTLFNSFYGDWYRLQTVALLTVNPDNPDWYFANAGTASSSFTPLLISGARRSFYVQAVPQYFEILMLTNVPQKYLLSQGRSQQQIDDYAASLYKSGLNATNALYGWDNRNSPGAAGCQDYLYVVLSSSVSIGPNSSNFGSAKSWGPGIGVALMAPPTTSDGLGSLGLNRNFFYDSRILNVAYWSNDPEVAANGCTSAPSSGGAELVPTTIQLTTVANSLAAGGSVTLHVKVANTDGSASNPPAGFVNFLVGDTVIGSIGLAAASEVDYSLDASLLQHGANQIVAAYRGDDSHLKSASAPVTVTVGDPGFTITPAHSNVALASKVGSQATTSISLTSNYDFTGQVQFSCANVPQYLLCTFSNSQLVAQSAPQTTTVTFTMIGVLQSSNREPVHGGTSYAMFSMAALAGLACLAFARTRGHGIVLLIVLLAVGFGATGCGGASSSSSNSNPPPNPVTATVTINATSGSVTQSQPIQVTIQ
ncbi:MAG: Ig-like domain repeat protein [Nitrospira sp.]|nr:Ig-like domain repeat protein [Nitrospira sp.]